MRNRHINFTFHIVSQRFGLKVVGKQHVPAWLDRVRRFNSPKRAVSFAVKLARQGVAVEIQVNGETWATNETLILASESQALHHKLVNAAKLQRKLS